MLFSVLSNCTLLREVAGAMLGLSGKVKHFQLKHIPRKSTLSDANRKRSHEVFAKIYQKLLLHYKPVFSDSRLNYMWMNKIDIIDFTTISLFKDILKCVGRNPMVPKPEEPWFVVLSFTSPKNTGAGMFHTCWIRFRICLGKYHGLLLFFL